MHRSRTEPIRPADPNRAPVRRGPSAFVVFLLVLLAVAAASPASAQSDKVKKTVLYINSYHDGYAWSDNIHRGINLELKASEFRVDLQVEYLDAKKFTRKQMVPRLVDLFHAKFWNTKFDAVIVSDNDAYDFITQYGEELFPGVPVIFCGLNDVSADSISRDRMTGILETIDARSTVELALKLHPKTRRMVIIGDTSVTGVAIANQVLEIQNAFKGRLEFSYWRGLDLRDIVSRVKQLPPDTILYFIPFYQDIGGKFYSAEELLHEVYSKTDYPLYIGWEFLLGYGAVGGKVLSGEAQGRSAARMALQVMRGTPVSDIPVVSDAGAYFAFDYNVLKKLGIPEESLPEGSRIINQPAAFYEVSKEVFWTIMISLVLLLMTMFMLVMNISERKNVENKIKEQLSFLNILMDTIPHHVCWKDRALRYLGANRAFADFYGIATPAAVVSRSDMDLMPPRELTEDIVDLDRQVLETNQPIMHTKHIVRNARGEDVWLEINKVPLPNERGELVGTLTTAEDVTREVNLEQQLRQSQKMEALGTLAGGIAHDFNNILTSIINSTELALEDILGETITRKDMERALRAAQRGSGLVKQILTFSRPSMEGFTTTSLADCLGEALGLLEASLPRNIRIRRSIEAGIGAVWADPTQIHQVVMNLCTNSFQAMKDTGGAIEILLGEEDVSGELAAFLNVEPGRYAKLTIADNGPGIPPEILDKVFDPFFTTKGKAEGTGLGLAVVHGIVKGHSGGLQLTSRAGERTSFDIYLPLHEVGEEWTEPPVAPAWEGRERVLFVEDDEDQLQTTPRILENLGYSVRATNAPEEVVEMLVDDHDGFDVVVTDFDMPGLDGIELARRIGDVAPELPIILVTGREGAAAGAAALKNIVRIVIKPYNKNIISDAIRQAIAAREA